MIRPTHLSRALTHYRSKSRLAALDEDHDAHGNELEQHNAGNDLECVALTPCQDARLERFAFLAQALDLVEELRIWINQKG